MIEGANLQVTALGEQLRDANDKLGSSVTEADIEFMTTQLEEKHNEELTKLNDALKAKIELLEQESTKLVTALKQVAENEKQALKAEQDFNLMAETCEAQKKSTGGCRN